MKNNHSYLPSKRMEKRLRTVESFKAKADKRRSTTDLIADAITVFTGTIAFLIFNILFFTVWIIWNLGWLSFLPMIDPYPFGLLTMIVSLEAIFLSIFVLISQNRQARIAEIREEVDLYINTYAEGEITKILYLLTHLLKQNGIDTSKDKELHEMLQNLESDTIEKQMEEQV